MSGRILLCTTDDTCPRHGKFIYFCSECHDEWLATEDGKRSVERIRALAAPPPGVARADAGDGGGGGGG